MGMYDEIICNYALPTRSPFAIYQTKSLDCLMATYEITEHGRLVQTSTAFQKLEKPEFVNHTGVIKFYNSNASASAFGQVFTRSGEDFESVTYEADFHNGEIAGSVRETERERRPALSLEFYHEADTVIDKDAPKIDETQPEVGAQLWRLWGGHDSTPYAVTLVIKTDREWALTDDKGHIEKAHESDIGNILFNSKDDAEASGRWRKESWKRKTQWCADRLAEKVAVLKA
jgi:hypothetical protein